MGDRYLWKFGWDCGRMGEVDGLFVASDKEIQNAIGKDVYFGEILGKHSEVYGVLDEDDLEKVNLDSVSTERVAKLLGDTWGGYNPLDYLRYECGECGNKFDEEDFDIELGICVCCRYSLEG